MIGEKLYNHKPARIQITEPRSSCLDFYLKRWRIQSLA